MAAVIAGTPMPARIATCAPRVYQHVNGFRILPRYSASIGIRIPL